MRKPTDNLRILETKGLIPPVIMKEEIPVTDQAAELISGAREAASNIIHGKDDRLLVLCGPCSIHDVEAAKEYGEKLLQAREQFKGELEIIMRLYFEKPRTTVGWKGLINDPNLDNSFEINKGIRFARQLLADLNNMGVPCGTEFLDTITPQYVAEFVSWGAIGARTTESQVHRELASGLSAPIGFKNGTDGNIQVAIDAMMSAQASHHFLSVTKQGNTAIFKTAGNPDTHIILRGGKTGPNYDAKSIQDAVAKLEKAGLPPYLMVDCSHGNSSKDHRNQPKVAADLAQQIAGGSKAIMGVMLESHLFEGNQKISDSLEYGKSITDACMSWEMTVPVLEELANSVRSRRSV